MKLFHRCICLALTILLSVGLCISFIPANAETAAIDTVNSSTAGGDGAVKVAENSYLSLTFKKDTGEVIVFDKRKNTTWYSNPEDLAQDKVAKGINKMNLQSQLLVNYIDKMGNPYFVNNFTGSIRDKAFKWQLKDNGIEIEFNFKSTGFTIPVRYSLGNDYLNAEILCDKIKQNEKYSIVNVSLLPYFGAGSINDEGYLVVPDGSGAKINFNNGKSIYPEYDEQVFGRDKALNTVYKNEVKEDIKLPVFGLKKNNKAFLGVISKGEYQGGITAGVSRKKTQYNNIYSSVNFIETETNVVMEDSANAKEVRMSSQEFNNLPSYQVRYYFLYDNEANYVGMAEKYRQYLIDEKGLKEQDNNLNKDIPLNLELTGAIKKRSTLLGIPYNTVEVLTSYMDIQDIATKFIGSNVKNISIQYNGWAENGMKDAIPSKVSYDSRLGGKSGFNVMKDYLEQNGIGFYPSADFINYYKWGNGFNKFFDTVKSVSRAPALQYEYRLSTGEKNRDIAPWYLLKPGSVLDGINSFVNSAGQNRLNSVALNSIGDMVYSDFKRNSFSRTETGKVWEEALGVARSKMNCLMVENGNSYTFPYADLIVNVPLYSSQFDIEDEDIPFYQIVLRGYVPYFSKPINMQGDTVDYLLKLVETGTYPNYSLIGRNGELLVNTDFDYLYSPDFSLWFESIVKTYSKLNADLKKIAGQKITAHDKIDEGVYKTTFLNNVAVIVNYNDSEAYVMEAKIPAKGYIIKEGI